MTLETSYGQRSFLNLPLKQHLKQEVLLQTSARSSDEALGDYKVMLNQTSTHLHFNSDVTHFKFHTRNEDGLIDMIREKVRWCQCHMLDELIDHLVVTQQRWASSSHLPGLLLPPILNTTSMVVGCRDAAAPPVGIPGVTATPCDMLYICWCW